MNETLLGIPFDVVLRAALLLGCFFAAWSACGMGDAYESIGHDEMSLDVPYTDDEPVDRGGSR